MKFFLKFFLFLVIFYSTLLIFPYGLWHVIQILRSIFHKNIFFTFFNSLESSIWLNWEKNSPFQSSISTSSSSSPSPSLSSSFFNTTLLTITSWDDLSKINLNKPFLIRNITSYTNILTLNDLLTSPIADLEIDYFIDATIINTVPNSYDQVGKIITKIMNGGPEKIGTQMIIKHFPEIIVRFVDQNPWLQKVFGENRIKQWKEISPVMTFPVFVSRGRSTSSTSSTSSSTTSTTSTSSNSITKTTTRTDLHCEPISNVVLQTVGKKKWTLVEPQYSHLLRPTISPDGRAYFYSALDPFDSHALDKVPHYEIITEEGDLLYVPTWTWHRIDYSPDITAVSISIFHFIPSDYLMRNPIFAMTLIPNLIKEALGIKEQ